MKREFRNAVRRLRWLIMLGGFAGAMGCATVDTKKAAKACADEAVLAAARAIVPDITTAIACMAKPDAGAEHCVYGALMQLVQTTAPDVFLCAEAIIHDQTIP